MWFRAERDAVDVFVLKKCRRSTTLSLKMWIFPSILAGSILNMKAVSLDEACCCTSLKFREMLEYGLCYQLRVKGVDVRKVWL